MSAGLAILNSLPGEAADLVRNERTGYTYAAGNVSALVERVLEFHGDREETRRMGGRGLTVFERQYDSGAVYGAMARHLVAVTAASYNQGRSVPA
jgi:hypothetical protein